MNRLTEFHNGVWGMSTQAIKNGYDRYSVFSKLAAYEDTGLEPEQIDELNKMLLNDQIRHGRALDKLLEYQKLEKQGLLIKLPCKVGDRVYTIFCNEVYEKTIDRIIINRFTTPQIWVETKLEFATSKLERWDMAIGKTIFLTREEAEKALEERK